jgi:hypothetical protein
MALSAHDRKVLAAIEQDLRGRDPELADLFATARPGGQWRQRLPVPLPYIAWLVGTLLVLILVHVIAQELSTLLSAALTAASIVIWLAATARATRGRHWGFGPPTRHRSGADTRPAGQRTASSGKPDEPDDDGCCPA